MLTRNQIKLYRSLQQKKYRNIHQLFIIEGDKMVCEVLSSHLSVECIIATPQWLIDKSIYVDAERIVETNEKELSRISSLKTPNQVIAVVRIPESLIRPVDYSGLSLYLDAIQDPGNMGTIIRIADWFGIKQVFCGEGCVDPYHPKTVQSTMGAIARVKIFHPDSSFLENLTKQEPALPIFGTFLNGKNIYNETLPGNALIVMGNESNGINPALLPYIPHHLLIPSYPQGVLTSDSLNVAIATAIVCSEFRRQKMK